MPAKIFVSISFYMGTRLQIGDLHIKLLGYRTDQGLLVFSPFGFWAWTTAGYLPPIAEHWRKTQEGTWAWQVDNPSVVHILLYQGENVVGAVSDFKRNDVDKRIRLQGYWILKEGANDYSGNYGDVSVIYNYY